TASLVAAGATAASAPEGYGRAARWVRWAAPRWESARPSISSATKTQSHSQPRKESRYEYLLVSLPPDGEGHCCGGVRVGGDFGLGRRRHATSSTARGRRSADHRRRSRLRDVPARPRQ